MPSFIFGLMEPLSGIMSETLHNLFPTCHLVGSNILSGCQYSQHGQCLTSLGEPYLVGFLLTQNSNQFGLFSTFSPSPQILP